MSLKGKRRNANWQYNSQQLKKQTKQKSSEDLSAGKCAVIRIIPVNRNGSDTVEVNY